MVEVRRKEGRVGIRGGGSGFKYYFPDYSAAGL
jgi:hypothetical protein